MNNNAKLSLCPNCFAQLNAQGKCSVCGYDTAQTGQDYGKLPSGTILKDRYYIGKTLGQGGFGITYLSYDLMLDVKLAIKEYYPSGIATRLEGSKTVTNTNPENEADFREGLGKFLAEARTLAKFSEYANIVSVRDYFEYNGTAYMVMGYLEGQTLLEYLKQHGNKLPFAETCKILAPVMDALNAVHASGLIHRDISPDNIFITHDGTVKLLDFGAAKSAMALANQQSHSIVLKKGYSPAEQYRKNGQLGPWTDVYSMGATFYRCLVGEVPQDSIDRLFEDEVARNIKDRTLGIPAQVTDAILKAMSINEADRFQNMSDFKTAMNRKDCDSVKIAKKVYEQPQADASKNEVSEEIEQPAKTKKKRKIIIAAAILYLAIAAFALYPKMNMIYAESEYKKGKAYYDNGVYASALPHLQKAADKGSGNAMLWLGTMYEDGRGVEKDSPKANELFRKALPYILKAADNGNTTAIKNLGVMYSEGFGVERNYSKAVELYSSATDQGDTGAMTDLAFMYRKGFGVERNYSKAVELYSSAADQGDTDAMRGLAVMYRKGLGVERNYSKAIELFSKAVDSGDIWAMDHLGFMYECGRWGVDRDEKEAIKWYRKCAEAGNSWGMYRVGHMYVYGLGVVKDFKEAVKWYRKSAEAGCVSAMVELGDSYKSGVIVEQNYEEARMWYKKAAQFGYEEALKRLNELKRDAPDVLSISKYVQNYKNSIQNPVVVREREAITPYEKGIMYYKKGEFSAAMPFLEEAANAGNTRAMINIGFMYYKGEGVGQDYKEAVKWYRKSAEAGYGIGMLNLGHMYEYGKGVVQDFKEAVTWYRKSAETGEAGGMACLGTMYEYGAGVEQDYEEARKWYNKAAQLGNKKAQKRLNELERRND